MKATVIGGGLAGCEAAWQLAKNKINVTLYEMKPNKKTPAHHLNLLGELVCSNSLRADTLENGAGLLKAEMRLLGSLVTECADLTKVPAGGALAVDRQKFSAYIEQRLREFPQLEVINREVVDMPDGPLIVAAGPLASPGLSETIARMTGSDQMYFHDAIAPPLQRLKFFRLLRHLSRYSLLFSITCLQ